MKRKILTGKKNVVPKESEERESAAGILIIRITKNLNAGPIGIGDTKRAEEYLYKTKD